MPISGAGGVATNADQIDYWNADAGEMWAALQERLDRQIEPLGRLAIEALSPSLGERVIDIGCGCGQTSLELADRVGPTGRVLGVDISSPMLAVARRRAAHGGVIATRFLQTDAQIHPFEPGGADAAFSRFGVMFFGDPVAAFANIRAALAPGGRLAFVCWRAMELNDFMIVPLKAAAPHLPAPSAPPDPNAPGPFAFADSDRVLDILTRAGFSDIDILAHDQAIGGGDIEEALETALGIGPLGRALREQPRLRTLVEDTVRSALKPYAGEDGVFLPSASWIVTARNGAPPQAKVQAR